MTSYVHILPATFQPVDFLSARLLKHADEARYLVSQIVIKTAFEGTDPSGFVRLHHNILRRVMDKDCIAPITKALRVGGVIEVAPHCKGVRSKGYRMTARYNPANSVRVPAIDPGLIERIERERRRMNEEQRHRWLPVHYRLSGEQSGLTITDEADAILDGLPAETRERVCLGQSLLIDRLRRREFYFSVGTTGRCFNNLCNLKRELRLAVRLCGEPLGNVDIRCSQLAMLGILLITSNPTFVPNLGETYQDWCCPRLARAAQERDAPEFATLASNGGLYERLLAEAGWDSSQRDRLKESVMRDILAQRGMYTNDVVEAFKRLFPSVYRAIRDINRDDHGTMIRLLQRVESWLVIETVAPRLLGRIPIVTLHDAIYCRRRDVGVVAAAFDAVIKEQGFKITLKCEEN